MTSKRRTRQRGRQLDDRDGRPPSPPRPRLSSTGSGGWSRPAAADGTHTTPRRHQLGGSPMPMPRLAPRPLRHHRPLSPCSPHSKARLPSVHVLPSARWLSQRGTLTGTTIRTLAVPRRPKTMTPSSLTRRRWRTGPSTLTLRRTLPPTAATVPPSCPYLLPPRLSWSIPTPLRTPM